jgi:anti-anti-sigma factor
MIRTDLPHASTDGATPVALERTGSRLVARVLDDLDAASAPLAWRTVREGIDPTVEEVRLELSGASFCDSSGLKLIFQLDRLLTDQGGSLIVQDPTPAVLRVLDIVDPAKSITVQGAEPEARAEASAR